MSKQGRGRSAKTRALAMAGLLLVGMTVTAIATKSVPRGPSRLTAVSPALHDSAQTSTAERVLSAAPEPEDKLREAIVGSWRRHKHGGRTITIHPDGRATAMVKLDYIGAFLYGEHLSLNLEWRLEGDVLTQIVTDGEPVEAVGRLLRDFGAERTYRVIAATEKELILAKIEDPGSREIWMSVPTPGDTSLMTAASSASEPPSANETPSANERSPR